MGKRRAILSVGNWKAFFRLAAFVSCAAFFFSGDRSFARTATVYNIGNCSKTVYVKTYESGSVANTYATYSVPATGSVQVAWVEYGAPYTGVLWNELGTVILGNVTTGFSDGGAVWIGASGACNNNFSTNAPVTSDPSTNMCTLTIAIRNNDVVLHYYNWFHNGAEQAPTGEMFAGAIDPGGTYTFQKQVRCYDSDNWGVDFAQGDGGFGSNLQANYTRTTNNATVSYPASTNNVTPPTPSVYDPLQAGQTNILWRPGDATNAIASQQTGDQAVKRAIDANSQAQVAAIGSLSNVLTISFNDSGITNAINRARIAITNYLAGISNQFGHFTNADAASMSYSNLWASGSNSAAGATAALTGPLKTWMDSLSGMTQPAFSGVDSSFWTITFADIQFNFNPYFHFPDLFDFSRRLIAWCLLVAYVIRVITDAWQFAKIIASATQISVPNIEGFATNIWTIAILPSMVVAFLLVVGVFIAGVAAALSTWITGDNLSAFTTLPWASGSPMTLAGVGLLGAAIPLNLVVSFLFSYVIWRGTMLNMGVIFAVWIKNLWKN